MKFFLILKYFLKEEIKLNFRRIKILYIFVKEFSILRFFFYLFNNSIIPIREKNFRNYILKNTKKWKNESNTKNSSNKNVLITNIFNHAGYNSCEIIIANNLMGMFNAEGIALLNYYDLKRILLYKSFGIKKIFFLSSSNIFIRFKYFIKAYLIIKSCKNIEKFLEFNLNNIEIGKAVYDHYLRFSGMGTTNKFENQFYFLLSKSLLINHQLKKCFKKHNIIAAVQSERQFVPGAIIFQHVLVNGVNVYSKIGVGNQFSIRRYDNIKERYIPADRYSIKLYDFINNNIKKRAVNIGGEIIKKRFDGIPGYEKLKNLYILPIFTRGKKINIVEKKNITKEALCKRLNWNVNFPIATIFSTDLTDGVFQSSWSLFRDKLTWIRETSLEIKKIDDVNWLIKPHPNDEIKNVITSTISEYEKNCFNCDHIKMFSNDISKSSIPKFIDVTITAGGSVGSEYSCFGIPSILACESICSGMGYTIDPSCKEEYFSQLHNIKKIKKLNSQQIELAKIYIFINMKLAIIKSNLIPYHGTANFTHVEEKSFWSEMTKLLDKYNHENDLLKKMMEIQEVKKDIHPINYGMIKTTNI